MVRAYTIRIYSDQGKVVWSELTQFAFTLIRESSMIRAYICIYYDQAGKAIWSELHGLDLL